MRKQLNAFFLLCFLMMTCVSTLHAYIEEIQAHVIPRKHKKNKQISKIFENHPHAMDTPQTVKKAGFTILFRQDKSKIVVLKHPDLKGYLIKGFLKCDIDPNWTFPAWQKLLDRCLGAQNIRKFIKKEKIKAFVVPEKLLYEVPDGEDTVVLLVTDMRLASIHKSYKVWKESISKRDLRELYAILSKGYGSPRLPENVPYTKDGTFAFIDTEYPQRPVEYWKVGRYLSEEMKAYWEALVNADANNQ